MNDDLERLRAAIRADGRPVSAIAKAVGMDPANLNKFVGGKRGIDYENGLAIERIVGVRAATGQIDPKPESDPIADQVKLTRPDPACCKCASPIGPEPLCLECTTRFLRETYPANPPGTSIAVVERTPAPTPASWTPTANVPVAYRARSLQERKKLGWTT